MKVSRQLGAFKPIIITLETREEAKIMEEVLRSGAIRSSSGIVYAMSAQLSLLLGDE